MKTCNSCHTEKPLSEFAKASTCKDGHRNYCKACHKLRKDAWRHANKDHHNAKSQAWAKANPERRKAICKKVNDRYIVEGTAKLYKREWRAANPDRVKTENADRRLRVKQATPPWSDLRAIRKIYAEAKATNMSVDHIIPLVHADVCGLHVPWNLQVITMSENYSKGNTFEGKRSANRSFPRKKDGSMK